MVTSKLHLVPTDSGETVGLHEDEELSNNLLHLTINVMSGRQCMWI